MIEHNGNNHRLKLKTQLLDSSVSAERAIVDYEEKEDTDLIVVSTEEKTGLKKMLLGSVASGVVTLPYIHTGCKVNRMQKWSKCNHYLAL